jgi:methyl-accepting chemotaxis protein
MTDQTALLDRLAKAMTRVSEAEHHISNQAARVAEMERTGQDARRSIMILATLREAHDRFKQEVEQILKELKRNSHP